MKSSNLDLWLLGLDVVKCVMGKLTPNLDCYLATNRNGRRYVDLHFFICSK